MLLLSFPATLRVVRKLFVGWRTRADPRRALSDPGLTRTGDLRFRKPPLYPPELRGRRGVCSTKPGRAPRPKSSSPGAPESMNTVWSGVVDPSSFETRAGRGGQVMVGRCKIL